MKNKYLEEIGIKSYAGHFKWGYKFPYNVIETIKHIPHKIRMWKQCRIYGGSCEENSWGLDTTSIQWLYTNLKIYLEKADSFIDLEFYKFNWHDKEYTQKEAIEYILEKCEQYLTFDVLEDKEYSNLLEAKYNIFKDSVFPSEWEEKLSQKTKDNMKLEQQINEELQDAIRLYAEIIFACWW